MSNKDRRSTSKSSSPRAMVTERRSSIWSRLGSSSKETCWCWLVLVFVRTRISTRVRSDFSRLILSLDAASIACAIEQEKLAEEARKAREHEIAKKAAEADARRAAAKAAQEAEAKRQAQKAAEAAEQPKL